MRYAPLCAILISAFAATAVAQVNVVCTTPGVADIAMNIGGEHVEVQSIMRGPENVHRVIPRPSYIMRVRRADLFVHKGLDGEPWVPLLIKGARQPQLLYGGQGNIDISRGVKLVEVPAPGSVTRAQGDIHVFGNPHYMLDPINGMQVARNIAMALQIKDPDNAAEFRANLAAYNKRLQELNDRLVKAMEPYKDTPVVTYHRAWSYLLQRYGLVKVAEVEPRPGIPPGPQSFSRCINIMKATEARIVIVETYNSLDNSKFIAERVDNGVAVMLAQEVNAIPEADTYEKLFEYNIEALIKAFEQAQIEPKEPGK